MVQLATKVQLTNDPKLRAALRADEERIAAFLVSIFSSKSDEEAVLRLEGDSAQYFLDVVQEVGYHSSFSHRFQLMFVSDTGQRVYDGAGAQSDGTPYHSEAI